LANLLQSSRSTFSRGRFSSFFAFKEGRLGTPISVLGGWPTVSEPFSRLYPSQYDLPVATVKKNPSKRLFLTEAGEEKRRYPLPESVGSKWALSTDNYWLEKYPFFFARSCQK
jgi:hypothetical protein